MTTTKPRSPIFSKIEVKGKKIKLENVGGKQISSHTYSLYDLSGRKIGAIDIDGFLNKPVQITKDHFSLVFEKRQFATSQAIEAIKAYQNQKEVVWYEE